MKTSKKIIKLINHGLQPSTLMELKESQINALYSRLMEQVTPITSKTSYKVGEKGGTIPPNPTGKGYNIQKNSDNTVTATPMEESQDEEMNWLMKGDTQDPIQKGPSTNDGFDDYPDGDVDEQQEMEEAFASQKQQKFFFSKCGDGKTKEEKKWCKMANEFAEKTNFKKLPKEVKETFSLNDLNDKIMSTYTSLASKVVDKTPVGKPVSEQKIEKNIMKLVEKHISPKISKKDFLKVVSEQGTKEAPVKEPITKPTRPKPQTPYSPKPGPAKAPKAEKKNIPSWLSYKSIGLNLK